MGGETKKPLSELIISILYYIMQVGMATLLQIIILLGPLVFLVLINSILSKSVMQYAYWMIGRGWYLGLFGWLGISIHELGHVLFCLLFGHKITKMHLFAPDPASNTLGSVSHSFNPDSFYERIGNFFIGIGPVILGSLTIFLSAKILLSANLIISFNNITFNSDTFNSLKSIYNMVWSLSLATLEGLIQIFNWQNLVDWKFYLFLYLTFAVGSSITLSQADIEGAFYGFGVFVIAIFVFNFLTLWMDDFATQPFLLITQYFASFYAIMFFTILLNLLALGVLLLMLKFRFRY